MGPIDGNAGEAMARELLTVERSARFYGDWMAGHERDHCEQIAAIVDAVRT